jgi:hypothetical protein
MSQQTEVILDAMSTVVLWAKKDCSICEHIDKKAPADIQPAMVDGPTQPSYRWGYMCHQHFATWGYPDATQLNKRLAYDVLNPENKNLPAELIGSNNKVRPEDVREVESLIQY